MTKLTHLFLALLTGVAANSTTGVQLASAQTVVVPFAGVVQEACQTQEAIDAQSLCASQQTTIEAGSITESLEQGKHQMRASRQTETTIPTNTSETVVLYTTVAR